MIKKDSKIILLTKDAIYSPCKVVSLSADNITITYFAGTRKDRKTGEVYENRPVETISRKNIVSMSERL